MLEEHVKIFAGVNFFSQEQLYPDSNYKLHKKRGAKSAPLLSIIEHLCTRS